MDIYSEIILDHYKNPRNFGTIKKADFENEKSNPLCGDKIKIQISIDKKKIIKKIVFSGEGCSISQSAASMLTEYLTGKPLSTIKKLKRDDMLKMLNIPLSPAREKCALLALSTIGDINLTK